MHYLRVFTLPEGWRYSLPKKRPQIPWLLGLVPGPFLTQLQEPTVPGGRHLWTCNASRGTLTGDVWALSDAVLVLHPNSSAFRLLPVCSPRCCFSSPHVSKMSGTNGKSGPVSGVMDWIGSACRFATDRNDFRRWANVNVIMCLSCVAASREANVSTHCVREVCPCLVLSLSLGLTLLD